MFHNCRSKICARCWVPLEPGSVVACPSCPLASYCGQECREEDREDHLQECTVLGPAALNISDQLRSVSFLEFLNFDIYTFGKLLLRPTLKVQFSENILVTVAQKN